MTDEGIIRYDFPYEEYLTRGYNNGIFSLENELRYSIHFTSTIKTIYAQDPMSGILSVFNCVQFLMDLLLTASFFLKNKALGMALLQMGPAGCGKSKYLSIKQSIYSNLAKPINLSSHFTSEEKNSSKSNSEQVFLFYANEASAVDFSDFKSSITDVSYKSSQRNLYELLDQNSNFANASYIINQNEEGLVYKTKNIFKIDDAFARRIFPINFSLNLGGSDMRSDQKTYYKDVKNLKMLNDLDPEFDEQKIGCLFYLLDLIEYFQIADWDENNIIKPCYANMRRALMGQYEPINVLRTENLIFMDEIYPDNSNEMIKFKMKDQGLVLKEELISTGKFQPHELTHVNLEKIASSLRNLLKINVKFCKNTNQFRIYDVKRYCECNEFERNAFEKPHKDWLGFNSKFNENDVQSCLPSALKFYINPKILYKFNNVVNVLYKNIKVLHEIKPEISPTYTPIIDKDILEEIRKFDIF